MGGLIAKVATVGVVLTVSACSSSGGSEASGGAGGRGGAVSAGGSGGQASVAAVGFESYPRGDGPGAVILIAIPEAAKVREVRFGTVSAPATLASAASVTAKVPAGLAAGPIDVKVVMTDGSTSATRPFTVLATPATGAQVTPTAEPAGYIGPIDNVWHDEASGDTYPFAHTGPLDADVVPITNMAYFYTTITGTLDRRSGIFQFTIARTGDTDPPKTFVGVYSFVEQPDGGLDEFGYPIELARLVFFPDAESGPEVVLQVKVQG
jgi:hypothetical protein